MKKGPGPRGLRDEEFLVPSLAVIKNLEILELTLAGQAQANLLIMYFF